MGEEFKEAVEAGDALMGSWAASLPAETETQIRFVWLSHFVFTISEWVASISKPGD